MESVTKLLTAASANVVRRAVSMVGHCDAEPAIDPAEQSRGLTPTQHMTCKNPARQPGEADADLRTTGAT